MPILFNEQESIFHLQTPKTSYIMGITKQKWLVQLHWGARIQQYTLGQNLWYYDRGFSPNPEQGDRTISLDTLPLEYPSSGAGDFRHGAVETKSELGGPFTALIYQSHSIQKGKPALKGLPHVYAENPTECETLSIVLVDPLTQLTSVLHYTIFEQSDAICRSVEFTNHGTESITLTNAASASVDFRHANFDCVTLWGGHINERNLQRTPVSHGLFSVGSSRGASSHQYSPFIALCSPNADEQTGDVYAMSFVYSGNFAAFVEQDQFGFTRLQMGINPDTFSWELAPKDSFQTPEIVLAYASQGFGELSRTYNQLYRSRLARGAWRDKARPVLLNNWEATYMDFNEEKIMDIAQKAKQLGVELFVLDDGWFGKRNDDTSSLGDWFLNQEKLPCGLGSLAKQCNDIGLEFGLWFEPEMISVNSDLYRKHPDWFLGSEQRLPSFSRDQLVLDLTRPEVCEYIVEAVSSVLASANISYVKWDMNRHTTEATSRTLSLEKSKETSHRYMLGLYDILEKITTKFPDILFESCSGGGGRFDAGMLYYMPQTWTSDNTDAISRLKIQYSTSLVFPPISMGCHVAASPNHQIGRETSLKTRGIIAMSGNLGYELDVTRLTPEEQQDVAQQIAFYKAIRNTIQFGTFYRTINPFTSNECAWNFVGENGTIVGMYCKVLAEPGSTIRRVTFAGLTPTQKYQNIETEEIHFGDELMQIGLPVPLNQKDFDSFLWIFNPVL